MADPREPLGRAVRDAWVSWAREQPDPKPSWLVPWDDLDDGQREVDMRIGEAIAARREDPRDYGLTGIDLHAAADYLYGAGDPRLHGAEPVPAEAARLGRIRSRLRSLADALDEPREP